jgi:hypothetical protein
MATTIRNKLKTAYPDDPPGKYVWKKGKVVAERP